MPKSTNWPEEQFADNKVEKAIAILEDAKSQYHLSGTRSGKDKATVLSDLIGELKGVVQK
jgi:hypothetical protein